MELAPVPASTLILPAANFTASAMMSDVLLVIHRGRFAGGADGHDAVHAALDLLFDQARERGFVQLAVFERRDNCGVSAGEHNPGHIAKPRAFGEQEFSGRDDFHIVPLCLEKGREKFGTRWGNASLPIQAAMAINHGESLSPCLLAQCWLNRAAKVKKYCRKSKSDEPPHEQAQDRGCGDSNGRPLD